MFSFGFDDQIPEQKRPMVNCGRAVIDCAISGHLLTAYVIIERFDNAFQFLDPFLIGLVLSVETAEFL